MSVDAENVGHDLAQEQRVRLAELRKAYDAARALADEYKASIDELERASLKDCAAERLERRVRQRGMHIEPLTEFATFGAFEERPHPLPASKMVVQRGLCSQSPAVLSPGELRDRYALVRSINSFSYGLGLRRAEGIKALKNAGIDIHEEIARDWQNGMSVRELSRCHGVGRDTISRWIRRTGRTVPVANSRRRYDEQVVVNVYQETRSCNRAAKAAGVAWRTAKVVLVRHGLWADERLTNCCS